MLTVPLSDVPAGREFAALEQSKRDLAARLGTQLLDHAETCTRGWDHSDWEARISCLQEDLRCHGEESAGRVHAAVAEARALAHANAEADEHRLRGEIGQLRAQLKANQQTSDTRCDQRVTETRDFYEAKLAACQERIEEACGASQNSTKKGQRGEEYVLGRLNMLFPRAEIEDTHTMPGRGDFVVRDDDLVMMIETKNYSRNVQKSEVDKFYRDLDSPANADFQCAVLVSLRSGVCCRDDFSFEMRGARPVLFIHHLERNFDSLLLAAQFFRLVLTAGESVDLQAKAAEDGFRAAASALKRGYAKQRNRLNRFHTEQLALVAEQEARIVELYGMVGQKL
jgi:hypothetical protein